MWAGKDAGGYEKGFGDKDCLCVGPKTKTEKVLLCSAKI